ncbi:MULTISPECIES: type I-E CRISPR-associated protein Cse2/CasB [unclassified Streptomyces]|uniref:type I-E CRISPR-associated protein Cse2/CasB n=1 Tax=unclassified Streptomyces TaxID=2593676 RepID=UPI002E23E6A5|nr:type I-E CRISPR-associated protein Cse2/CasB [Streptomyces sp. NBC_00963]
MTTQAVLTARQRVEALTGELIVPLQSGYLGDQSFAVGALARLRRGAGKEFSQVPDLWGLVDTGGLHTTPGEGVWPLSEVELTRGEDALHVALTLWALHQQSRGTPMHRTHASSSLRGLGAGVRALMPPGKAGDTTEAGEAVRKRLVRSGTAPGLTVLSQRLRDIVVLLRGRAIPLDYAQLAGQLYRWQEPGGRDVVRREWGRSFHSYRPPQKAGTGTPASDHLTDLTDKDAS